MVQLQIRYSDSYQHIVFIGTKKIGRFLMNESGEFCYFPEEHLTGYWPADQIRMIADKLDEINKK